MRELHEQCRRIYSFRTLSEAVCRVKARCPSRYGKGDLYPSGIRENHESVPETEAALTAMGVDDILNVGSKCLFYQRLEACR